MRLQGFEDLVKEVLWIFYQTLSFFQRSVQYYSIAIKMSSHSFGMRAGLPSCIRWMMATALFSHSVRAHSSLVRCDKVELRGGHCCCAGKKGLSGAEGGGRVLM